jgi:hypothetical protein
MKYVIVALVEVLLVDFDKLCSLLSKFKTIRYNLLIVLLLKLLVYLFIIYILLNI